MYRLGERKLRYRKVLIWPITIALILVAGTLAIRSFIHSDSTISPTPPPKVTKITYAPVETKHFDEPTFGIDLPSDWKLVDTEKSPYVTYQWAGGTRDDDARSIKLYIGHIPATLGVNRAVAVQANGDKLLVESNVSDNCSSFTQPNPSEQAESTHAKWDGTDFLCDLGNYLRDVVGTSSPEGINSVTLTGSTTGGHTLFFTYTDNTPDPDYSTFISALKSFQLK